MQIRIAGLVEESFVDGDGIRFAIFMQGCQRRCEGCHNPETHSLDGGRLAEADPYANVTFSGGDPMYQPEGFAELARAIHTQTDKDIWCYTGYSFENLPPNADALLENVDVLIDGEFIESQRDLELQFRGSRNQRIIDVKRTREQNKIVLWTDGG